MATGTGMHPRPAFTRCLCTLLAVCAGMAACDRAGGPHAAAPIVGTWRVRIPEAPFPEHLFTFHADGTVLQSNPDAGDPNSSDSNAMGAWRAETDRIKGKLIEVLADRSTHQFTGRGEISFSLRVAGDTFTGTASAVFYDAGGGKVRGPVQATMEGHRVSP